MNGWKGKCLIVSGRMSSQDIRVFDTEPLIAFFFDEDGSDVVQQHLQDVRDGAVGVISRINLTEVMYIAANEADLATAKTIVRSIRDFGFEVVESMDTWETAGMIKHTHSIALGDSYAVAAADHCGGTLIVGADDDFDSITEVPITQFRTDPAP